jgi:hypothetical protein
VQIERKTKRKAIFLLVFRDAAYFRAKLKGTNKRAKYQINLSIFESEYLRQQVKGSANRAKNQKKSIFLLVFRDAAYFRAKLKGTNKRVK